MSIALRTSRPYAPPAVCAFILALFLPLVLGAQSSSPAPGIRHAATRDFTLVVKGDGAVVGWGRDPDGQAARPPSPKRLIRAPVAIDLPGKALQVALGQATQYALLEDGTVVSWGTNDEGQLGNGPMDASGEVGRYPKPSFTPVKVTGLSGVIQIAAGMKHAVALRKDGTVWTWGQRGDGVIGNGEPKRNAGPAIGPTRVPGLEGIKEIAADAYHNLALRSDGRVMVWGRNHSGELGTGTRDTGWMPVEVKGLDRVVAIAAGSGGGGAGSSGAVRDDGSVWMWGTGTSSMTGNDPSLSPDDPGGRLLVPEPRKGVTGARRLSIGAGHAGVLLADGTVRMWGLDGYGQIGVGTSGTSSETYGAYKPMPMTPKITNVASLYLGGYRSIAVRTDGTLWVWGITFVDGGQGVLGRILRVPTLLDLESFK